MTHGIRFLYCLAPQHVRSPRLKSNYVLRRTHARAFKRDMCERAEVPFCSSVSWFDLNRDHGALGRRFILHMPKAYNAESSIRIPVPPSVHLDCREFVIVVEELLMHRQREGPQAAAHASRPNDDWGPRTWKTHRIR